MSIPCIQIQTSQNNSFIPKIIAISNIFIYSNVYIGILGSSQFFSNILLNIANSSYFSLFYLYTFYFAGVLLFLLYILILPLYSLFFCMMAESDYIIQEYQDPHSILIQFYCYLLSYDYATSFNFILLRNCQINRGFFWRQTVLYFTVCLYIHIY